MYEAIFQALNQILKDQKGTEGLSTIFCTLIKNSVELRKTILAIFVNTKEGKELLEEWGVLKKDGKEPE